MSETVPNQGLFRMYAVAWVVAASMVVVVAFAVTDLPPEGIAAYLLIGAILWIIDMVLTKGGPRPGHAASHAVLVAAFALIWPLIPVALIGYLAWGAVRALRDERAA
ncbi:hypothetical protein OOK29_09775 [Streptomyces phaeochromogenes]|uniref:hypothetical protein n=1 Tax=Streptomyces phaeochromogenes TaxID=1923 RepID=UPI0022560F81|nr:hypothetical protein [Streptomyces phaeochromogenes]MCX5598426.1 hypothetical protein [Streptomyces phaeochromogenes]